MLYSSMAKILFMWHFPFQCCCCYSLVLRLTPNLLRDTAEQLLYRLRELEEDAFVRISHTLGLGPIDYQRRVSGQMSVSTCIIC